MKNLLIACLFIGNIATLYAQETESTDVALIKTVVEYYHKALESSDKETVLKLLSDDLIIQEGGHYQTGEDYKSSHLISDMAFTSVVKGTREVIEAVAGEDIGWVISSSIRQGEFKGKEIDSMGAEMMILKKEDGVWKIRAIHWSSRDNKK